MVRTALIVAAGLAALAACYLAVLAPALKAERVPVISTPGLGGLNSRSVISIPSGKKACTKPIYLTPSANRIQYLLAGPPPRTDGIGLTVTGSGLASRATGTLLEATGADTLLTITFIPNASSDGLPATFCLTAGSAPLDLVGTTEANSTIKAETTVDGKTTPADPALVLLGPANQTTGQVLSEIPSRVSATTLGLTPPWLVWALVICAVLAAALLPLAALAWADRLNQAE